MEFRHLEFETVHPVVRTPLGDRRSLILLLGHFGALHPGLSTARTPPTCSAWLQRHITGLENTARWTWLFGDIAIRATGPPNTTRRPTTTTCPAAAPGDDRRRHPGRHQRRHQRGAQGRRQLLRAARRSTPAARADRPGGTEQRLDADVGRGGPGGRHGPPGGLLVDRAPHAPAAHPGQQDFAGRPAPCAGLDEQGGEALSFLPGETRAAAAPRPARDDDADAPHRGRRAAGGGHIDTRRSPPSPRRRAPLQRPGNGRRLVIEQMTRCGRRAAGRAAAASIDGTWAAASARGSRIALTLTFTGVRVARPPAGGRRRESIDLPHPSSARLRQSFGRGPPVPGLVIGFLTWCGTVFWSGTCPGSVRRLACGSVI